MIKERSSSIFDFFDTPRFGRRYCHILLVVCVRVREREREGVCVWCVCVVCVCVCIPLGILLTKLMRHIGTRVLPSSNMFAQVIS